jgi:hypothetical protein
MVLERNFLDRTEHCCERPTPCSKSTQYDAQLVVHGAESCVGVRLCTIIGRTLHPWLVSEFISTRRRRGRAHFGHSGECNIVRRNALIRQYFIVEKCGDSRGGLLERIDLWTCSASVKQLISCRYHALRLQCLGLVHRTTDLVLRSQKVIQLEGLLTKSGHYTQNPRFDRPRMPICCDSGNRKRGREHFAVGIHKPLCSLTTFSAACKIAFLDPRSTEVSPFSVVLAQRTLDFPRC